MYKRLRKIRNELNITAREMANLLGLKTENAYYKKESGQIKISVEEAKIIAGRIGRPIEDVFFPAKCLKRKPGTSSSKTNKRR